MKKRIAALIMAIVSVICLTACGGGSASSDNEELAEIIKDETNKSVTINAQVNGMFFDQSTMHYCVWKDGGNSDNCMLVAFADSQDFYDALEEAGGTPWNTTTDKLSDGEFTDGQKMEVTLKWDGQDTPVGMADTLKTNDGKPEIDIRFSGNKENNDSCKSGCITCLNSCWAGITSNAAYAFGAVDSGEPSMYLDDSVMPEDGTIVQITFTLR